MLIPITDPDVLRQGDIIENVLFPIPRGEGSKFSAVYKGGQGPRVEVAPAYEGPPKRPKLIAHVESVVAHCAIMSQCCDLDPAQNPPPPSVVLCRVVPVPDSIRRRQEHLGTLLDNVDPFS